MSMDQGRRQRLERAAAQGDRRAALALRVDAFKHGAERVDPAGLARDLGIPDLALPIARAGVGTLRGLLSLTDAEAAAGIRPADAAGRVIGVVVGLGLRFRLPHERPLVALPEVAPRRDVEAAQAARAAAAMRAQGAAEEVVEEEVVADGLGVPGDDEGDQDPLGLGEVHERPPEILDDPHEVVADGIGIGDEDEDGGEFGDAEPSMDEWDDGAFGAGPA